MKCRRDDKSQKITAFLSSVPPTKRASGVEDGGVPSSSSSEDWNQPASSEQREPERYATASANMAKHKTGYNRTWEADHTWVFYIDGEGMYCKLCRKFDTKNRQNQAKVWNTEPCTTLRKDVLARHEASAMHKEAVEQERACQIVKARGGIREAVQGQVALLYSL